MTNQFRIASVFVSLAFGNVVGSENQSFDATIPVVDMNDFYHEETKHSFVDDVAGALHEIGFFAVINTGTDQNALMRAYGASESFFNSDQAMKDAIHFPALNGQRGYIPGETAQGFSAKDYKEFVHIGRGNNVWPSWMDLEKPMMQLISMLDEQSIVLQQAFALALGEDENFFVNMTAKGDCLLRALHYPANPTPGRLWAAQHTDIDLFTILPMATEEGLQVWHDGKWIHVKVPPNAFIVNGGDMLQNISNGYFKSSLHQVVAKPDVERYSIVYFVHPRSEDSLAPTPKAIAMTDGVQHYPQATRIELLAARLRELGLASPELLQMEKDSGFIDRIKALVDAGVAADPVLRTHRIWVETQN